MIESNKKYQIIYADPPWGINVRKGTSNKLRPSHYSRMSIKDIAGLQIPQIADINCALFLWVTMPALNRAFEVIETWGFRYSTVAFTWVKLNKNNMGLFTGCGWWTRANAELCLLGIKGSLKRVSRSVPQIIASPIMNHSRKPDEIVRDRIIALLGDLPRVEIFSRRKVEGWDCWGNEVDSDIEL